MKKLKRPVTLAEIKADERFKDFPLTYLPRLSVMPVTEEQWKMILEHGEIECKVRSFEVRHFARMAGSATRRAPSSNF